METLHEFQQLISIVAGVVLGWLLRQWTERERRKTQEAARFDQTRRELFGEFAGWARLLGGRVAALLEAGTVDAAVTVRDRLIEDLYRAGQLEAEIDLVAESQEVRTAAEAVMAAGTTFTFDSLPVKQEIGLNRVGTELPPEFEAWQADLNNALDSFMGAARKELRVGRMETTKAPWWCRFRRR